MQITKAKKWVLWDTEDRRYIDFTSGGIFAAILGANNVHLKMACSEANLTCCYGARFRNKYTERYKDMLRELTGYESVVLFSTGSEATEAFWRACRVYTGRFGIWGGLIDPDECGKDSPDPLYDSMHGMTLGAMIMAGKMNLHLPGVFEGLGGRFFGLTHEQTGAAIFEPYHAPAAQFHKAPTIDRIKSNMETFLDIHFCCDEVQGGLGRTGKLFAHEWYEGLRPQFVCMGKAIGGGYPLSALLGPKDILEDSHVLEHAHLHSTHSGHPVMANIGIEVLDTVLRENLIQRSYDLGLQLAEGLRDCGVRVHAGRGLLAGLEFRDAEEASEVVRACERRGLLVVETRRKWVKLGPPYIISEEDLDEGITRLRRAVEEVLSERTSAAPCGDSSEQPGQGGGVLSGDGLQAGAVQPGEVGSGHFGDEAVSPGGAGTTGTD